MAPHSSTLAWKIPWMEAAVHGVAKSWTQLSDFTFTFHFHALEKEMATYCSVLAWRIPGTWEPGGLPSMGSHRVGHDWSDLAAAAAAGEQIQPGVIMFMPIASPLCVVGGVQLADCSVMGFLPLLLLVCMLASCGFISSFLQIWEGWNVSWSVSVFNWLFC